MGEKMTRKIFFIAFICVALVLNGCVSTASLATQISLTAGLPTRAILTSTTGPTNTPIPSNTPAPTEIPTETDNRILQDYYVSLTSQTMKENSNETISCDPTTWIGDEYTITCKVSTVFSRELMLGWIYQLVVEVAKAFTGVLIDVTNSNTVVKTVYTMGDNNEQIMTLTKYSTLEKMADGRISTAVEWAQEAEITDYETTTGPEAQTPTTTTAFSEPIILSGISDSVVDLDKWEGPALAHITRSGGGHFAIWSYGANNEKYELLVNTIGPYEGIVPIDFSDDEQTRRFEVNADGSWEIVVLPLSEIRREIIPGTITGSGDDVIFFVGTNPDLLIVDGTNAKGHFAIWAYGKSKDLLVNDVAPYSGTVLLDTDAQILVITEDGGGWSLEVTTN